jgi:hypothetical protein
MKIVLSKKGFDSKYGKVPSPILQSGELFSLPIPESLPNSRSKRYDDIKMGSYSLGAIVNDLTRGNITPDQPAHLDPDLNFDSIPRPQSWKPIFGQAGSAESHLQNQGVKEGDIFLFFGWFRQVEQVAGKYKYVRNAPDLHIIFGWLQIERRISVDDLPQIPASSLAPPYSRRTKYGKKDSIYVGTDLIKLPNSLIKKPGAGTFKRFDPALCLTAPSQKKSLWQLPSWFYPYGRKSNLSYHQDLSRWTLNNDYVLLNTVARGQEFVLDCDDYPEAIDWLCNLLNLAE